MNKHSVKMTVIFSVLVFLILTITMLLMGSLMMLLFRLGIISNQNHITILIMFAAVSIIMGTVLSKLIGKRPIRMITEINDATKEVAKGNFNVELNENIPAVEIQEMAHNFNMMIRELAHTEMFRSDFIENVSHEFKTPLSAIEGYTMLLQKKGLSEEKQGEYTQKILYNVKRLSALTGNILLLSRLENQEIGISKEMYCLDEQIREIILVFEDQWTAKNLELEIDLDSFDFYGNKDLLAQVWQNIFENAVKFSPDYGLIRVALKDRDHEIQVSITDNGIGMSEEVMQRIYEKFYQGDTSRTSTGNGLGLALVKRIVDLHNGKIEVSSEESKGSTFTVILPY